MLTVQVDGDKALVARLQQMPDKVHRALLKKVTSLAIMLERYVKRDKLSGQVLNVRTGALRSGIFHEVDDEGGRVVGKVSAPRNVPYAAIHEFGGKINIPEIVPLNAKALRFTVGGQVVFAMRARAHTVTMPERSYLRSALDDKKNEILRGLEEAVQSGLRP